MKNYIGIDGGGTKTRCIIADDNLKILHTIDGGPSNPLVTGFENAADCLFNLIATVIEKEKTDIEMIRSIAIGLAGVGRTENKERLQKIINEKFSFKLKDAQKVKLFSDAETALEGAFNGEAGSVLIAGTGSIIYGKDEKGNISRCGGLGKIIGDEGGGYSIGKKGLNAAARYYDGRGNETLLVKKIFEQFGIVNSNQLINKIYTENYDIASAAKYVIECAEQDDEICKNILDRESDELILLIAGLIKTMNVIKMNLCLTGSLLTTTNYYSKLVKAKILQSFPRIKLETAIYPPEIGAVLLAKKSVSE